MRCIVATLGFDAANVVRPLLSIGLQHDDRLVLLTSSVGGDYERERAEKAVQEVETITGKKAVVLSYPVVLEDLSRLTSALADACHEADSIVAVLSGGLRPLALLALSASILLWRYRGVKLRIVSMREDGLSALDMTPEHFSPPEVGDREKEVLEVLAEHGGSMRRISLVKYLRQKWGTSHVVVYRRLRNLERKRLLEISGEHVRLLPLGLAVLEALTR